MLRPAPGGVAASGIGDISERVWSGFGSEWERFCLFALLPEGKLADGWINLDDLGLDWGIDFFRVYGGCAASIRARVAVGGLARRRLRPRAGSQQHLGLVGRGRGARRGMLRDIYIFKMGLRFAGSAKNRFGRAF